MSLSAGAVGYLAGSSWF